MHNSIKSIKYKHKVCTDNSPSAEMQMLRRYASWLTDSPATTCLQPSKTTHLIKPLGNKNAVLQKTKPYSIKVQNRYPRWTTINCFNLRKLVPAQQLKVTEHLLSAHLIVGRIRFPYQGYGWRSHESFSKQPYLHNDRESYCRDIGAIGIDEGWL